MAILLGVLLVLFFYRDRTNSNILKQAESEFSLIEDHSSKGKAYSSSQTKNKSDSEDVVRHIETTWTNPHFANDQERSENRVVSTAFDTPREQRIQMVETRRSHVDKWRNEYSSEVFNRAIQLFEKDQLSMVDMEELNVLEFVFPHTVRQNSVENNQIVFRMLSSFLSSDEKWALEQRQTVLRWIGKIQTPESVALLLETIHGVPDLETAAIGQLAQTGSDRWGGRFQNELSPVLENAWRKASGAGAYEAALAGGIIQVGASSGLEILIDSISVGASSVEELKALQRHEITPTEAWHYAILHLERFRNPQGFDFLENILMEEESTPVERYVAGEALSSTVSPEAFEALLRWAGAASAAEAGLATRWFSRIRDPKSRELVVQMISSASSDVDTHFADPYILNAIIQTMNTRQ